MRTIQSTPTAYRDGMADTIDLIKLALISQLESSGSIDIAEWVGRYPMHRDELLDFWMWLSHTSESEPSEASNAPNIDSYEEALQSACLAVTLGPQWLKPAVDPEGRLETLAADLEAVRRKNVPEKSSSTAFRKAVVCTWVVARLQQTRPRVTRLAVQKVTYLLEEAMTLGIFVEHNKQALGPYDSKARYKDAEPIARKKGWLEIEGTTLRASQNLDVVNRYLPGYLRAEEVAARFVDKLNSLSDDQLETLATTHWVARELKSLNIEVTVETVLRALAQTPEWRAKLGRPHFKEHRIAQALTFLGRVGLVRGI